MTPEAKTKSYGGRVKYKRIKHGAREERRGKRRKRVAESLGVRGTHWAPVSIPETKSRSESNTRNKTLHEAQRGMASLAQTMMRRRRNAGTRRRMDALGQRWAAAAAAGASVAEAAADQQRFSLLAARATMRTPHTVRREGERVLPAPTLRSGTPIKIWSRN